MPCTWRGSARSRVRSPGTLALTAALLAVIDGCPTPPVAGTSCQRDAHCPAGFVCDQELAVCVRGGAEVGAPDTGPGDRTQADAEDPPDGSSATDLEPVDRSPSDAPALDGATTAPDAGTATDATATTDATSTTDATTSTEAGTTTDATATTDATLTSDATTATDAAAATDATTSTEAGAPTDATTATDANATTDATAAADAASSDATATACAFPLTYRQQSCRPVRVLLLYDGSNAGSTFQSALAGAGFDVVSGGLYHVWDGAHPSLADRDTILALQGTDYAHDFGTAAKVAITAFVASGGGLVRTEWAAWRSSSDPVDALLPVIGSPAWATTFTWSIRDASHPLARGLADNLSSGAGFDLVTLRGQAVAVIETTDGHPVASYTREHGGTSVHLNHDVTHTAVLEPHITALYLNAVWFSALP